MIIKKDFKDKIALVTGGSKGIGRSICEIFAKQGAKVIYTYRKNDKSVKTLKEFSRKNNYRIIGYQVASLQDINLRKLVKQIKKKHKKINYLINNIGDALARSKFTTSSDKLWIESINVNLMSAVRMSKYVVNHFSKNELSSIVNIGSIAGKTFGQGDSLHYGVAKAALHGFSKGLSRELDKIRVNCIAPNAVDTDFQKRLSSKKRLKNIIKKNKAQRLAKPEEIAELTSYLCSKKASYINGEVIFVTGGLK